MAIKLFGHHLQKCIWPSHRYFENSFEKNADRMIAICIFPSYIEQVKYTIILTELVCKHFVVSVNNKCFQVSSKRNKT